MYPEPYISTEEWRTLRQDLVTNGAEEDDLLQCDAESSVFGMNLAFGWPLPSVLKDAYQETADALAALDSGLFVYPYQQTHVTVMTLVNFKNHPQPSEQDVARFLELVPTIVSNTAPLLSSIYPFAIDIGPPVLARRAVFLPIRNQTGEIAAFRGLAAQLMGSMAFSESVTPRAIHSTIGRFIKRPTDMKSFLSEFESVAARLRLGEAIVDEFLLTSETQPYMRAGRILHRFRLGRHL